MTRQLEHRSQHSPGYTVIELLVVVLVVGILAAIVAPSWLGVRNRQAVNATNTRLYLAIREAQDRSLRTKDEWRASFREDNDRVYWAVHRDNESPRIWQSLRADVSLAQDTTFNRSGGVYYVEFNERGRINGRLGRVTVTGDTDSRYRRCTIASTLLGTLRQGSSQVSGNNVTCD